MHCWIEYSGVSTTPHYHHPHGHCRLYMYPLRVSLQTSSANRTHSTRSWRPSSVATMTPLNSLCSSPPIPAYRRTPQIGTRVLLFYKEYMYYASHVVDCSTKPRCPPPDPPISTIADGSQECSIIEERMPSRHGWLTLRMLRDATPRAHVIRSSDVRSRNQGRRATIAQHTTRSEGHSNGSKESASTFALPNLGRRSGVKHTDNRDERGKCL